MRARPAFTYIIERIFDPQELFFFIQEHAGLSDDEMYATFNMGMDYAIFLPEKDVKKAQGIIANHAFQSLDAGFVDSGEKQVIIKPKNIISFKGKSLDLR
jgi:phosphoribosylformylglycinamidine cyclo-ligase